MKMMKMILRPLIDADLEMILAWRNDLGVRRNMYTSHVISAEEHWHWFESVRTDPSKQYYVFENAGDPRGVVAFTEIEVRSKRANWAFYASPNAPRGTGSKMEYLALEHAFGDLRLHKLYCEVLACNELVIKLHRSFGFSIEGTLREHHYDGEHFHDICQLGILNGEWAARRSLIGAKLKLDAAAS